MSGFLLASVLSNSFAVAGFLGWRKGEAALGQLCAMLCVIIWLESAPEAGQRLQMAGVEVLPVWVHARFGWVW